MQSMIAGTPWVEKLPMMGANVDYSATATIGAPHEVDTVTVSLVAGTTYTLEMLGVSSLGTSGSLADPMLRLFGPNGVLAGADDDSGVGFDPTLTFVAAASGNYTLELSAVGNVTGSYSLQAAAIAGTAMTTSNTYAVSSSSTVVIEGAGGLGRDVVSTSVSYALSPGSEIEALQTSRTSAKTAINLTGNEFAQTLIGNTGANVLEGKGGADILYGNKGNDRFVLSNDAVTSAGAANIDAIMDYAAGDLVDVTQILAVAPGDQCRDRRIPASDHERARPGRSRRRRRRLGHAQHDQRHRRRDHALSIGSNRDRFVPVPSSGEHCGRGPCRPGR
jgi:hypothetical protein